MTYALRFLPQVEADVLNGRAWYEDKAPGLGEEFLRVFYASAEELARNPQMYQKVHRDFRRRLLRRFPYAIYFRIEGDRVVIFVQSSLRSWRPIRLRSGQAWARAGFGWGRRLDGAGAIGIDS